MNLEDSPAARKAATCHEAERRQTVVRWSCKAIYGNKSGCNLLVFVCVPASISHQLVHQYQDSQLTTQHSLARADARDTPGLIGQSLLGIAAVMDGGGV